MKYFPDNSRNTVLSQISMVLKTVHQPPSSPFSKNNLNTVHYSPENIYKADKLYLGRHPEMRSLIFLKRSFGIIIMYMYLPFHEHCHISRLCWMLFLLLKSFLRQNLRPYLTTLEYFILAQAPQYKGKTLQSSGLTYNRYYPQPESITILAYHFRL